MVSRLRLLREPDDRKPRIGGTRTGVELLDCVFAFGGGLYDTGGRWNETRLSSGGLDFDPPNDLIRSSSLCPCTESGGVQASGDDVAAALEDPSAARFRECGGTSESEELREERAVARRGWKGNEVSAKEGVECCSTLFLTGVDSG